MASVEIFWSWSWRRARKKNLFIATEMRSLNRICHDILMPNVFRFSGEKKTEDESVSRLFGDNGDKGGVPIRGSQSLISNL